MATDPLVESKVAEAAQAAAVAHEANSNAREAQMHETLVRALKEVLTDEGGSPMLIKRIPFICTDIGWIKRAVFGIFAFMAALLLAVLVSLLTK